MTELAIPDQTANIEPTSAGYRNLALAKLGEWAEQARAAHTVAQSLCKTSFVPEALRNRPEETTAAILAGAEVGLTPLAAVRSFDIIQGVAAPRALTLRAIVQSLGHEILIDESTNTRCRVRGRRKGSHEWQTVTWTIERAQKLGLTTRGKPPRPWETQPQNMLIARATSEACRLIAADAILGLGGYTAEELGDGVAPASIQPPTTQDNGGRRMGLPETTAPEQPTKATDAQIQKIGILCRERGLDPATARDHVGSIISRSIKSRRELTKDEAHQVIDALEADTTQEKEPPAEDQTEPEFDDNPGFDQEQLT